MLAFSTDKSNIDLNEHKKLSSYFRELAHGVAMKDFSEADAIPSLDNKRHGSTNNCSGSLLGLSTVYSNVPASAIEMFQVGQ